MAGVVGRERMQFDVFGDHVIIASKFDTESKPGMINVSGSPSAGSYKPARKFIEFPLIALCGHYLYKRRIFGINEDIKKPVVRVDLHIPDPPSPVLQKAFGFYHPAAVNLKPGKAAFL
ncbi:MAG: hypothetical protein C4548_14125 [Desulfobacteraceae bacterium]|nr:MAG: hypothetical protein C4548_14125 [Desulfobacteraceae bacterium]